MVQKSCKYYTNIVQLSYNVLYIFLSGWPICSYCHLSPACAHTSRSRKGRKYFWSFDDSDDHDDDGDDDDDDDGDDDDDDSSGDDDFGF